MLDNTVSLQLGGTSSTAVTDLSLNDMRAGTSVRSFKIAENDRVNLYVQNQTSKENAPVGSNRSRISLERIKVLSDGSERKIICSWNVSTPRDATFTTDEINGTVKGLIGLLTGFNTSGAFTPGWHTSSDTGLNGSTLVARIRAGEE